MDEQQQQQPAGQQTEDEDLDGLKTALQKERAARRELERQLKNLGDLNPEEYRRLQQQSAMMEEWERRRSEEIGSIKNTYETQLQRVQQERERMQQEREQMAQALVETEMTYAITEAFYQSGGKRDANIAGLIAPRLLNQVSYDDEGRLVAVDAKGNVRLRDDGKVMGVNDLMNDIKSSSYGILFDPVDVGGTGASGSRVVSNGRKLIKGTDPAQLGKNIEAIAKGETLVDMGL